MKKQNNNAAGKTENEEEIRGVLDAAQTGDDEMEKVTGGTLKMSCAHPWEDPI